MNRSTIVRICASLLALTVAIPVAAAQAPKPAAPTMAQPAASKTPTQAYLDYIAALKKATKIEDVMSMAAPSIKAEIEKTPPAQRPEMFGMMKMFTLEMHTGVKVVKETITGSTATLNLEGLGPDNKKATGTVALVKEGAVWKVGKESW